MVKKDDAAIAGMAKNYLLSQSEDIYHKMIEEVEDYAILLLDKDGTVLNWNRGAEKIKGYTDEEIIGKHFRIFYLKEDQDTGLPERLINEAAVIGRATHEGWRVRKDRTTFWGSILITALHDSNNDIIGFSKVTRDLTERKKAEEQLRAYASDLEIQNKELEQFVYVASHDLQEPLRKIRTFGGILESKYKDKLESDGADIIHRIQQASDRMRILIEDLLNYSKISTLSEKENVDTAAELIGVLTDLEVVIKERGATVDVGQLYPVYGNAIQIRQLFQNLLSNALKFHRPDVAPLIKITAEIVHGSNAAHVVPPQKQEQDYQRILVQDNGIGFEQQYAEKIFHVFQRLNRKEEYTGSGVGLSIVQKVVEKHDGYVIACSEPGVGTTFEVLLPYDIVS